MKTNILILIAFGFALCACNQNPVEEEIICNTMFVFQNVEVKGAKLDTCYTIRKSNNDTVPDNFIGIGEGQYTIITDRYLPQLRNSQDTFHFIGIINDSVVVREPYVIGADACHIYLTSGKEVIVIEN